MESDLAHTNPGIEAAPASAPAEASNSYASSKQQSRFNNLSNPSESFARDLPLTRSLMAAAASLVPSSSSISMYRSQDIVELIRTRHATLAEALRDQSFDDDTIANIEHSACDDDPQQTQLLEELRRIDRQYREKLAQIDQMEYHLLTAQGKTVTSNNAKLQAQQNFANSGQIKQPVDEDTKTVPDQSQSDGSKLRNLASFLDIAWLQSTQAPILVPTRPEVIQNAENPMYARMSDLRRRREARNWRVELSRRRHSVVEFYKHQPVTITAGTQQADNTSSHLQSRGDGRASLVIGTKQDEVIKNQDGRAFSEQTSSHHPTAVMYNRQREARRRRKMHAALNQHIMALMPKSRNALQYVHFDAVKRQRRREKKRKAQTKALQSLKIEQPAGAIELHETKPIFTAKPSAVIVFDNYEPGTSYERNFEILNVSHVSSHCRASKPTHPKIFKLEILSTATESSGCMAPGISTHYRVMFRPDSRAEFSDCIEFYGVFGGPLRVQLIARRPMPVFLPFNSNFELGKTVPGTRLTTIVPIECSWTTKKIVMTGKNRERTVHNTENGSTQTDNAFILLTDEKWNELNWRAADPETLIALDESTNCITSGNFIIEPRHFVLHGQQNSLSNQIHLSFSYYNNLPTSADDSLTLFLLADNAAVRTIQLHASCGETHIEFSTCSHEESEQLLLRRLGHNEYGDRSADFVADFSQQNPHSTRIIKFCLHNPFQVPLPIRWRVVEPICEQQRIMPVNNGTAVGQAKPELELDWWQEQQSSIFSVKRISTSGLPATDEADELVLDAGATTQFALVCYPKSTFAETLGTVQLIMSNLLAKPNDSELAWREQIMLGFLTKASSIPYNISVKPLIRTSSLNIVVGTTRSVYVLFTNKSLTTAPVSVAPYEDDNFQAIPRPQSFQLEPEESIKVHYIVTAFSQTGHFEPQLSVSVHGEYLRNWCLQVDCSPPPLSFVSSSSPLQLGFIQLGQSMRTTVSLQNHSDLHVEWQILDCYQPAVVQPNTNDADKNRPDLNREDTRILCPYTLEDYVPFTQRESQVQDENFPSGESANNAEPLQDDLLQKDKLLVENNRKLTVKDAQPTQNPTIGPDSHAFSSAAYDLKFSCTSSTSPVLLQHSHDATHDPRPRKPFANEDNHRQGTLKSLQIQHFILELQPLIVGKHSLKLQAFCSGEVNGENFSSATPAAELVVDWTAQEVSLEFEPKELLLTENEPELFINVPISRSLSVHNRSDINVKFHFGPLHAISCDDTLVLEAHVFRPIDTLTTSPVDQLRMLQNQSPSSTIFHLAPRASKTLQVVLLARASVDAQLTFPSAQTASLPCFIHGHAPINSDDDKQNLLKSTNFLNKPSMSIPVKCVVNGLDVDLQVFRKDTGQLRPISSSKDSVDFGIDNPVGQICERMLVIKNTTAITTHVKARVRWHSPQTVDEQDESFDALFPKKQTRISGYYTPTSEKKATNSFAPPPPVVHQVGALFSLSPDEAVLQPHSGSCTLCIRAASNLWGTYADFIDLELDEIIPVNNATNSENDETNNRSSVLLRNQQQLQRKTIQIALRYGSTGCPLTFQLLKTFESVGQNFPTSSASCTLRFGTFAFGITPTDQENDFLHLKPRTLQINNPLPLPIQIEWETTLLTYGGENVDEPIETTVNDGNTELSKSRQVIDVVFRPNDSLTSSSSTANGKTRKVVDVFFLLHEGSKQAQNIVAVQPPINASATTITNCSYIPPSSSTIISVQLDASKVDRAGVVRVLCLGRLRLPEEYKKVQTFPDPSGTVESMDHATPTNSWARFDGYYAQPLRFEVTAEAKPTYFYVDLPQTSRSLTFHAKISDLFVQRQQISVAVPSGSCRKFTYEASAEVENIQHQGGKAVSKKSQSRSCLYETLSKTATFSSRQKTVASPPPPPSDVVSAKQPETVKFAASPLASPLVSNTRGWSIHKFHTAKCVRTLRLINSHDSHMKFRFHVTSPPFRIQRVLCLSLRAEDNNTDRSVTEMQPNEQDGFYFVKGQQNVDVQVEFAFDYSALAIWLNDQRQKPAANAASSTTSDNSGRVVLRDHILKIEFGGLQIRQEQTVPLYVSILTSKLEWSVENLRFRECLVHEHKDMSFSLRNRSNTAALWKVIVAGAEQTSGDLHNSKNYQPFLATPSTGWLPAHNTDSPDQSKQIITVQFRPKKPEKTEAYLVVYDAMEQDLGRIRLCGAGTIDYSAQER